MSKTSDLSLLQIDISGQIITYIINILMTIDSALINKKCLCLLANCCHFLVKIELKDSRAKYIL